MPIELDNIQGLVSLLLPDESDEVRDGAPEFPYSSLIDGEFDSAQIRFDNWTRWQQTANRIAEPLVLEAKRAALVKELGEALRNARSLESLWVFPGIKILKHLEELLEHGSYNHLRDEFFRITELISKYGDRGIRHYQDEDELIPEFADDSEGKHYFTTLVVADIPEATELDITKRLADCERPQDRFIYNLLFVSNMADAIEAVLNNRDIQACIMWQDFPFKSLRESTGTVSDRPFIRYIDSLESAVNDLTAMVTEGRKQSTESAEKNVSFESTTRGYILGNLLNVLRPHLHLYYLSEVALSNAYPEKSIFKRSFNRHDDPNELHMTLIEGVRQKYRTPFFDALKRYAERPVGNFHALPIARGNSVFNSKWLADMREFYGDNIFLAESSATSGGLDSLLSPHGPIKEAQEKAAHTFGAKHTFFVTNGTSTANKIVGQALLQPGDIVLIDRNCHKSHHYSCVLLGAHPIYLDAFAVEKYGIYGGVELSTILSTLESLRDEGLLDRVKMVLLTNCTFDGIVYNPSRVMHDILAIKPDICFLWDEAWFAYARLFPTTRRRTAMKAAEILDQYYTKAGTREQYAIRVYSTHSTHKSLSCLRQGSMIHVYDDLFESRTRNLFNEAYFTHTSTSPNYQILATLDLARRQVEFEGFPIISSTYQKAAYLRKIITEHEVLSKYLKVLTDRDIMQNFEPSDTPEAAWLKDEFVLDPTRITLYTAKLALGGDDFKNKILMDKYGIQVNKTGLNNVLFILTIGATWSGVHYLIDALLATCKEFEADYKDAGVRQRHIIDQKISKLENDDNPTSLPNFSHFHESFRVYGEACSAGNMREAYFLDYEESNRDYIKIPEQDTNMKELVGSVAASFIIPYPPGFPILVPGQVISEEVVRFMQDLDIKEIHGYDPELGLPVIKKEALPNIRPSSRQKS